MGWREAGAGASTPPGGRRSAALDDRLTSVTAWAVDLPRPARHHCGDRLSNRPTAFVDRVPGDGRPAEEEMMTMRYLALLGEDEAAAAQPDTPAWEAEMAGHMRFSEVAADAIHGGEALQPVATAVTVRHGDGVEPLVTTGPYAETSEALGGFYVFEAATLDDAIDLARQIPTAESGWVALRPLVMWQGPEGDAPAPGGRFLATIYGKESPADQPDTPAWDEGAAAHGRFVEAAAGAVLAGAAVHPVDTTTTVQVRDGELVVTDGPVSEAAEIVGGLYVLGAPTMDAAVGVATAIPVGPGGAVEVRPVMEIG